MRILVPLLLLAATLRADTHIALPPGTEPIGLAAAADGTLWYAAPGSEIGRVLPGGAVQSVRLAWPFVLEGRAAVVVAPDGSAFVGDVNGQIARVDAQMHVATIPLNAAGTSFTFVKDMTLGADGRVWFVATAYATPPFLGRINADLSVDRFPLAEIPSAIASAPDGSLYVGASDHLYRATTSGALTAVADCRFCGARWLEVLPDGTVWSSSGRLTPDGTYVRGGPGGRDATVGPDGTLWVATDTNALREYSAGGTLLRELPFLDPGDEPRSIASSGGALWYGLSGALRRFDPQTRIDLRLRMGDVVAVEMEPNCCFEGSHPVLAFHRRGGPHPFVRRIEATPGQPMGNGGVYAVDASRILVGEVAWEERPDPPVVTVLDGEGIPRAGLTGPPGAGYDAGIVVDRDGRIHALRQDGGMVRLLTYGPDGGLLRELPLSIPPAVQAIDLAADQCTLFHVSTDSRWRMVGRVDICSGAPLAAFLLDPDAFPRDLRILPGGDVLVVHPQRLVRYRPDGTVARQYDAPADDPFSAVALDPDPAYVWVGARELRRMHLATGAIAERLAVYGPPAHLSVIGEPRAARRPAQPPRRRALRP